MSLRDKVNIIAPLCWQTLWAVSVPITKEPDVSQLAIAVFKINDFDKIAVKQRNLFPSCFFHTLFKQYR